MGHSRTTAKNRLSELRGSVDRRRRSTGLPGGPRASGSRAESQPQSGVSVPFSTGRALAISQDPVDRVLLDERLSTSGEFDVDIAADLDMALELACGRQFDAIVLDQPSSGEPTASTLSQLFQTAYEAAVVVIGESADPAVELAAIDAGACEYVSRDALDTDALLHAVRRTIGRNRRRVELDRLANADPLTGLLNRRGFDELAARALEAAERLGSMFTVLLLDIDGLEQINRGFGHSEGDEALRETARIIVEGVRTTDIAARIGGDEFCVALTDGSPPPEEVARVLGRTIDQRNENASGWLLSLTLGASHSDEWSAPTLPNLVDEAGSRMRTAKPGGESASAPPVGPTDYWASA